MEGVEPEDILVSLAIVVGCDSSDEFSAYRAILRRGNTGQPTFYLSLIRVAASMVHPLYIARDKATGDLVAFACLLSIRSSLYSNCNYASCLAL